VPPCGFFAGVPRDSKFLYIHLRGISATLPSFTLNMSKSDGEEMTFGGVTDVKK